MFDVFYTGVKPDLFSFERPADSLEDAARQSKTRYCWFIYGVVDFDQFDFDYTPVPWQAHYTHVWPTEWSGFYGAYLVDKHHVDAEYHVHQDQLPTKHFTERYQILEYCEFDLNWEPHPWEPPQIYVFGNQHYPGTIMPTVKYTVPGATELKFLELPVARLLPDRTNWQVLEPIDEASWDWTWRPNPVDPPYTYVFGNQWNPPEHKASVRYQMPGATEVKHMEKRTVRLPQPELFEHNMAVAEFDYSWEPNPFDPPFTYVFGNQWNPAVLEPTVIYNVTGATEIKYINDIIACVASDMRYWELLDEIESFDYSWRPNPRDPAYTYVFGNQWATPEQRPALQYRVPGATEVKYMDEPKAQRVGSPELFNKNYDCDFDYSWEPDPHSPPFIYVFGNQHWPANIMPTVEYHVAGATEIKYLDEPKAKLLATTNNWSTLVECEFDYTWMPEPGSPALIYVFGNQHYPAVVMPTVEYRMPGATERKYMDNIAAKLLPIMDRWSVPEEVDRNNIDFSWCPHPKDVPYIHHFGTEHQMSIGLTYTVPGATELKFEGEIPRIKHEQKVVKALEIFFIDRGNIKAQVRYERLHARYEKVIKVRYVNSLFETIQRCVTRAQGNRFWVIGSEYNYDKFDFYWHAEPWQSYMTHVFASQHNKWSDTFLINRWEFERHAQWATSLEQFPNLNFVQDQIVDKPESTADIYYVDHGNPESDNNYNYLKVELGEVIRTRFVGEYLDVLKRIVNNAETEYVWVVSSLCRYNYFDFTWEPEPWQREMIHCFASGNQRRGDTFYIHVESFKKQMVELELLDWFNVINYVENISVDRYPMPIHVYTGDDLITEIKGYDFKTPYVLFTNQPDLTLVSTNCLWSAKDRTVVRATQSGATCKVPRDIKQHLKTQIYDYPYLDKHHVVNEYYNGKTFPGIDIVYISNGEPDEEKWYDTLCYRANLMSRDITWIRGVNGRTAAYQAAARASTTPWFFAVFAKLEVDYDFPWQDWMPDYWQEPKHYIFNARNPVNGLEYGHMSVIAYNKNLVLSHNTPGIDFTLSQPHEHVPILSGIAHFNQNPIMTWRTAFRETLKLKHFNSITPTVETEHRLDIWLTKAQGNYAEWCLKGSNDAIEYYRQANGDYTKLLYSFEWKWLNEYFEQKYGSTQIHL